MKLLLLFFFFTNCLSKTVEIKVIKTPIFHSTCKLHDVTLFTYGSFSKQNIYAIDFCPVEDIQNFNVVLKIILGRRVNGSIRIFKLRRRGFLLTSQFLNGITREEFEEQAIEDIKKVDIKLYNLIKEWDTSFQLYGRNCKHFRRYLIQNMLN
jgi:hypothetical protein